jgi:hypothetical protein
MRDTVRTTHSAIYSCVWAVGGCLCCVMVAVKLEAERHMASTATGCTGESLPSGRYARVLPAVGPGAG